MTTPYNLHHRHGLWVVERPGEPSLPFIEKHLAEAWMDAMDAQRGREDVVAELRAIRDTLAWGLGLIVFGVLVIAIAIAAWVLHDAAQPQPPQATPPSLPHVQESL